jgi:transcriptional regulator with XRE-family HTH domain
VSGKRVYDRDRIRELRRKGLSQQAIATRMGCSTRTVRRATREGK